MRFAVLEMAMAVVAWKDKDLILKSLVSLLKQMYCTANKLDQHKWQYGLIQEIIH